MTTASEQNGQPDYPTPASRDAETSDLIATSERLHAQLLRTVEKLDNIAVRLRAEVDGKGTA